MKRTFRKTVLILSLCGIVAIQNAYSANGFKPTAGDILTAIKTDTGNILTGINNLPGFIDDRIQLYIVPIYKMALSWLKTDDKPDGFIPTSQASFSALNSDYKNNLTLQESIGMAATKQFMTNSDTETPNIAPPNINQLDVSILKGTKIDPTKDKDTSVEALAKQYLYNISAANFYIPPPPLTAAKVPSNYQHYYDAIIAIESFNTRILSGLYVNQDKNQLHSTLTDQATSKDWFLKIATEDLGLVLRQLLMYTSQIYVQIDHLTKIEQDQLAAQAMTNTLLILETSQNTGALLRRQALPGGS